MSPVSHQVTTPERERSSRVGSDADTAGAGATVDKEQVYTSRRKQENDLPTDPKPTEDLPIKQKQSRQEKQHPGMPNETITPVSHSKNELTIADTLKDGGDDDGMTLSPVVGHDGTTGEYKPEPIEEAVPRMRGTGLAGIPGAPLMSHHEHIVAVRTGQLGSVHSWELVTAVDGPGTRMTVFMAGCQLRCLYCHNPDTWIMRDGHPTLLSDLIDRVTRYKPVFDATGGGITVSGGEPMLQAAFLRNLLRELKQRGIQTCIDTCGFLGRNLPDDELKNLDLVLLDVKSGDPETYKRVTGKILQPTIDFGDRLAAHNVRMWVRYVLVPGLTDAPDNVNKAADIVARWNTVERVEVLPFHKMGEDKWRELNVHYELTDTMPPSKEETEAARDIFRARGLQVF